MKRIYIKNSYRDIFSTLGIISTSFVIIIIWYYSPLVIELVFPLWKEKVSFGDIYDSLNALFTGLAFAGLVFTIYLQRKELKLTREEMKKQRQQMERSAASQIKQRHHEILKMSIEDKDLSRVLGGTVTKISNYNKRKQHLFMNLIFNHFELMFQYGIIGRNRLRLLFENDFEKNPYFQDYWGRVRKFRKESISLSNNPEKRQIIFDLAEKIYMNNKFLRD